MSVDDPQNFEKQVRNQLDMAKELDEKDSEDIRRYGIKKKNSGMSPGTLKDYLSKLRLLSENSEESLLSMSSFDIEELIDVLRDKKGWTDGTTRNYQKAIKSFLRHYDKADGAEDIEYAQDDSGGKVSKEDIVTKPEYQELIQSTERDRDKAIISILYDTGMRISAVCSLQVKHFEYYQEDGYGDLYVNDEAVGLKNLNEELEKLPVTISVAHINNYLNGEHPRPNDEKAPLIHKIEREYDETDEEDDGSVSPSQYRKRLKRLAKEAGIEPHKVKPHNWRHSAISRWAMQDYSRRIIRKRAGWSEGTDQFKRYEHLAEEDLHTQFLKNEGIDVEEETNEEITFALENCPQCNASVEESYNHCPQCGLQLDDSPPEWLQRFLEDADEDDPLAKEWEETPFNVPHDVHALDKTKFEHVMDTIETLPLEDEVREGLIEEGLDAEKAEALAEQMAREAQVGFNMRANEVDYDISGENPDEEFDIDWEWEKIDDDNE